MKKWRGMLALLSLCCCVSYGANSVEPKWTVDVKEKFGFQAFDREITFRWTLHQGVLFLSPDSLLVYQVNRSRGPVRLSRRDASGGGGNFVLDIRVLSTLDGHEIKAFRLPTNAEFSKVMATRQGRFVVRTGDILYLYSADFQRIAAKPLPLRRQVQEEGWQIDVSPSGEEVALVHQEILKRDPLSPTSDVVHANVDLEILDAETFSVTKRLSLPWFLASWFAADHTLLTSTPTSSPGGTGYGLLDFEGHWSELIPDGFSVGLACPYQAQPLDNQLFAAYGCGNLSVFPLAGRRVFFLKNAKKEHVGSVQGGGDLLAVLMEQRSKKMDNAGNIPMTIIKPLRIEVFNLKTRTQLFFTEVRHSSYYAVSPSGRLAVVDGTLLELFEPAH